MQGRKTLLRLGSAYSVFFIICCGCRSSFSVLSVSVPSLLGVHPLDEKYFDSTIIKCKDGSNWFTRDRLNDNFCDCVDGTDEPGTSACPRGRFYCKNVGSTPQFLFSSRVNDNICDCCDGSDEYDSRINCPTTCIMGGNIEYKAEMHHSTSSYLNPVDEKESKVGTKLEDLIQNLKGLKVLAILQLALVGFLLAYGVLFCRVRSRSLHYRNLMYKRKFRKEPRSQGI
ncbi:hypothetical protein Ancab_011093 [Ancistrocladus abbreviatus]